MILRIQSSLSLENWKMERQFDKAIEGLRKLKDEPVSVVSLTSKGLRKQKPSLPTEESQSDDNETFVISPFSENQTYTIKVKNIFLIFLTLHLTCSLRLNVSQAYHHPQ